VENYKSVENIKRQCEPASSRPFIKSPIFGNLYFRATSSNHDAHKHIGLFDCCILFSVIGPIRIVEIVFLPVSKDTNSDRSQPIAKNILDLLRNFKWPDWSDFRIFGNSQKCDSDDSDWVKNGK
jgi:hypothetical protein